MTSTKSPALRALAAAPVLLLVLAACGGGSGTPSNTAAGAPTASPGGAGSGSGSGAGSGARQAPGASGQIADVSGGTLQVRTSQGQTAVQVGSSTLITEQKTATVAAVTVGACVVATGQPDGGSGLTATAVTVAPATGTGCTAADNGLGRGGFGGGFGGGARPSGSPRPSAQNRPSGAPTQPFATAFGTVTAVTPTTITLKGRLRSFTAGTGGAGSPGASPSASAAEATVTVQLGTSTRYTSDVKVAASVLAVGQCVTALGQPNDIGTVAARSITIRPAASDGTCSNGFGGFGRRPSASPSGGSNG